MGNTDLELIELMKEPRDYEIILKRLVELEKEGNIILYAGTYSFIKALDYLETDSASFYFYTQDSRCGYLYYVNPMGVGLYIEDGIFKFSNRRFYRKSRLSNTYYGEKDYRSGEYFKKRWIWK